MALFSWKQAKEEAIKTKVRRAMLMAKVGSNSDFTIKHPDWVRDAGKNNYVDLKIKVTEQIKKSQDLAITRRLKTVG